MRERDEAPGFAAQEKGIDEDMRVDIWTIREEHIVFENVILYHLSDKERFAVIEFNNGKSIEYYPTVDIRRIKLTKTRGRNKG